MLSWIQITGLSPDAGKKPAPPPTTHVEQKALLYQDHGKEALDYLLKERCLSPETVEKYQVGVTNLSFGASKELCLTFPWLMPDPKDPENEVRHYPIRHPTTPPIR